MCRGKGLVNKIDSVLKDSKKTRKELAEKLNIIPATMATWKTKDIMPPIETIKKIAEALNVSVSWLISDSNSFEEKNPFFNQYSRKSIRLRIYTALKNKYEKDDHRFTADFLDNESLLKELHYYYFNGGFVSYEVLFNWSKGRCEIDTYFFDQCAIGLNTTLQFILTGSEVLIPSEAQYSKPFEKKLYDLALEFRNELYSLDYLTDDRKKTAITVINQLTRLEHLEYPEAVNQ